jgi:hypothetical protein
MKQLICFCCGTEITSPQFFNGKAYGYTCITKVSNQKRIKDSGLWVAADSVELVDGLWAIFTVQGIAFKLMYGVTANGSKVVNNGLGCLDRPMVKLAMFKNGKQPIHKSDKVAKLIKSLVD